MQEIYCGSTHCADLLCVGAAESSFNWISFKVCYDSISNLIMDYIELCCVSYVYTVVAALYSLAVNRQEVNFN